ncbi:MAG: hypothetical protein QXT86_10425 [Archaeoglobaceae archaeon]
MKEFWKEKALPFILDIAVSFPTFGKGVKLAEKVAFKLAPKLPRLAKTTKSIGGFLGEGYLATVAIEARRTFLPVTQEEKKHAYDLPHMMERIEKELPQMYLLMAGGTGVLYAIKGAYKAGKVVTPQPVKKALQKSLEWSLDKFLFGIDKKAREIIWKNFGHHLTEKHLEIPSLFPAVQRLLRSAEFQEYVEHYTNALRDYIVHKEKAPHLVKAFDTFLTLDKTNPPGQRIMDYLALENFLISYYEKDPKLTSFSFYKVFSEFEKNPFYQKLVEEKEKAFVNNFKSLLRMLVENDKEKSEQVLRLIKDHKKIAHKLSQKKNHEANLLKQLDKAKKLEKKEELLKKIGAIRGEIFALQKMLEDNVEKIAQIKPRYLQVLGIPLEKYYATPTEDLVKQIFEKLEPSIREKARSYLVRNVIRIPRTKRVVTVEEDTIPVLQFIEDYFDDIRTRFDPGLIYARAFKKREFPTLGSRFISFLKNNINHTMTDEEIAILLQELRFYGNVTPAKAFMISLQYPKVVESYRKTLHDLVGTKYVYLGDPLLPEERNYQRIIYADFRGKIDRNLKQVLDQVAHFSALREDVIYGGAQTTIRTIANINGFLKFWFLKFSPFHYSALSKALFAKGADPELWGIATGNALSQAFFKRDAFDMMEATLNVADALKILHQRGYTDVVLTLASDVAERQGFVGSMSNFVLAKLGKTSPLASLGILRASRELADLLYDVYNFDQRFLWDGFWRTVKLLLADGLVKEWRKGHLTDAQLAREIKALNDIFGGATDWYFIPYAKAQLIRLLLFAPDWYLSLWRNFTTWLKGDTITSADFFPNLARLHLYFANLLNTYYTGKDLFDYHQIDKWDIREWIANWRELYRIRVPFIDKTGRKRVLTLDTVLIEFEPLEMLPILPFVEVLSHELVKEKDTNLLEFFERALARTSKEWLQYWYNKKSTILNIISQIGALGYLFRTSDDIEFWERFWSEGIRYLIPLSFIQFFNIWGRADRYLFMPDDVNWVNFFEKLQSFSFKIRATERFADYVAKNLYNPSLPDHIAEFLKNYYYLSLGTKTVGRELGLRKTEIKEERVLKDLIDNLAEGIAKQVAGYKINVGIERLSERIIKEQLTRDEILDELAKIYLDALKETYYELKGSYLPDELKEEALKKVEKVLREKARRETILEIIRKFSREG